MEMELETMDKYDDKTYGEKIAGVYDELYAGYDPQSIEVLADLAGDGPVLELGIGTGRIALPLLEQGIPVYGIDASEAMLSKLRSKKGGEKIKTVTGSFAEFKMETRFRLVYVVFNTFFALLAQEEQVQCFRSVREHLSSDGVFLLEAFVPDLARFEAHQALRAVRISDDFVQLDASQHDPVTQQVVSQHVMLTSAGNRLYPVKLRYAWPSELDLMARIAGLSLLHRWSSWSKAAFTRESTKHISVYAPTAV
jgi:SAM-dependent methyltransferase